MTSSAVVSKGLVVGGEVSTQSLVVGGDHRLYTADKTPPQQHQAAHSGSAEKTVTDNKNQDISGFPTLAITRDSKTTRKRLHANSDVPDLPAGILHRSGTFHGTRSHAQVRIQEPPQASMQVTMSDLATCSSGNDFIHHGVEKGIRHQVPLPENLPRWQKTKSPDRQESKRSSSSQSHATNFGAEPPRVSQGFWKSMRLTPGEIQLRYRHPRPSQSAALRRPAHGSTSSKSSLSLRGSRSPMLATPSSRSPSPSKLQSRCNNPTDSSKLKSSRSKSEEQQHSCPMCKLENNGEAKKAGNTDPASFIGPSSQDDLDDPDRLNDAQIERFLQNKLREAKRDSPLSASIATGDTGDKAKANKTNPHNAIELALKAARRNRKIQNDPSISTSYPVWRGSDPPPRPVTSLSSPIPQAKVLAPASRYSDGLLTKRRDHNSNLKVQGHRPTSEPKQRMVRDHPNGDIKEGLFISRSLTLYNMSLPMESDTQALYQGLIHKQAAPQRDRYQLQVTDSLPKEWRTDLTPRQWVQLLKANPGDPIFQTLGLESQQQQHPQRPTNNGLQSTRSPIRLPSIGFIEPEDSVNGDDEMQDSVSCVQSHSPILTPASNETRGQENSETPMFHAPCNSPETTLYQSNCEIPIGGGAGTSETAAKDHREELQDKIQDVQPMESEQIPNTNENAHATEITSSRDSVDSALLREANMAASGHPVVMLGSVEQSLQLNHNDFHEQDKMPDELTVQ